MWAPRGKGTIKAVLSASAALVGASLSLCGDKDDAETSKREQIRLMELRVSQLTQNLEDRAKGGGVQPTVQETEAALQTAKKTVAIFGGSFDPITNAHLANACSILHNRKADEVWLVPSGNEGPGITQGIHRLIMAHTAVNGSFAASFPIKVKDLEVNEKRSIPTYELFVRLRAEHPDIKFVLVIGSDMLEQDVVRGWEGGQELWNEFGFLGMRRPGFIETDIQLPPNFRWIDDEKNGGNGTAVVRKFIQQAQFGKFEREAIRSKDFARIEGLMPAGVVAHIIRNDLYSGVE